MVLKNEKGSVYIYVLIIGIIVFMLLALSLNISGYDMKLAKVYEANLYNNAVDGVEAAEAFLNNKLSYIQMEAYEKALNEIKSLSLADISVYKISDTSNPYNGEFHLKERDYGGLLGEEDILFRKYFSQNAFALINEHLEALADSGALQKNIDAYGFSYEISHYNILVEITPDNAASSYRILSVAANLSKNVKSTVRAQIDFNVGIGPEIFIENYNESDVPSYFSFVVSENQDISNGVLKDYIDLSNFPTVFTPENPICLFNDIPYIDISSLYINDEPVVSAIINISDAPVELYASDAVKNKFTGIIISVGEVNINGSVSQITGSVISEGAVFYDTSSTMTEAMPSACLLMQFSDISLKRRFFDIIGISDFHGITENNSYRINPSSISRLSLTGGEISLGISKLAEVEK